MAEVLHLEDTEFFVDGIRFGALTAVNPDESDESKTILTSDGPIQVGTPKSGSEVKVESPDIPRNIDEDRAQMKIFEKGKFNKATFTGIKNYRDGSRARETWTLLGGTVHRNKGWSATDQTSNSIVFKSKVVMTVEPAK